MINIDNMVLTRNRSLTTEGSIIKQLKVNGKAIGQVISLPRPTVYPLYSTSGLGDIICTLTKPAHATGIIIQCSFARQGTYARFGIEECDATGAVIRTMPTSISRVNFLEYVSTAAEVRVAVKAVTDLSYYWGYTINTDTVQDLQVAVFLF
jgi:hypothetical protein